MRFENGPLPSMRNTKRQRYLGRTSAYRRLLLNQQRTRMLLELGILGLEAQLGKLTPVERQLSAARAPKGRRPKGDQREISVARTDDGRVSLKLDAWTASALRRLVGTAQREQREMRFHHYAVLAVHTWGTYETYLTMLFEELFVRRPQLLIANETITLKEAIEHRDDIVAYLTSRQLERVGRLSFGETTKYLKERLNYEMRATSERQLGAYYLVRNIVAHNTGRLRAGQAKALPLGISAAADELRVTKAGLVRMLDSVAKTATSIERHVEHKFFKADRSAAAPSNQRLQPTAGGQMPGAPRLNRGR